MPLHSANDSQPFGGNLWAPPLLFRRRPPQSNCPPDTVSHPDYGCGLEFQYSQSSIPPTPPPKLALRFPRLLPILYKLYRNSISGCSKAPRGLSVLSRVTCIFTGTIISPSLSLRQCPDRYAFRAGRNLPDKEFRYLRTVIVTAAVYWGFGSVLAHLPLTFQHWAGISPYTYTSVFAETYGFVNQSPGPFHCGPLLLPEQVGSQPRAPLLPKLRGYFAEFLNEGSPVHLGILSLPTCVGLRYGHPTSWLGAFLGSLASTLLPSPVRESFHSVLSFHI